MTLPMYLDDFDVSGFLAIARSFDPDTFGFAVAPNADHVIRYFEDPNFRDLYGEASFILFDSRFLARIIAAYSGTKISVCPGSDLTEALFQRVITPRDRIVLIGGTVSQTEALRVRYGLESLFHVDPPMGFIRNPNEVEKCLREVEGLSPFRFCLVAIGSPQQEIIATKLKQRGVARGLALCIGASVNFLTGAERRAPLWMQRAGIEWLYRLLQNPGRMARRYLVRGPRVFLMLPKIQWQVRQGTGSFEDETGS